MCDIYFWRQVFVLSTTILISISTGIMVSFPSVLMPALLSSNSTNVHATKNQVSWIATSNGIAGIFGFFVQSPILQIFGRRVAHITGCLFLLIGWIIFALAHNVTALMAARIFHGFGIGGVYIHVMIVSEYTDPKRRGYFTTVKKASNVVGTVMCHALSLIWNWRQIATFTIILPAIATVLTLLWPESPSYLAMKGRFKESEKSFIWLRGASNLKELHLLHSSQQQEIKNPRTQKWHQFLFKKDFLKPFAIISLLTVILELSGKHYFAIYVIQMMMDLVEDKSLAIYFSIGADLFTLFALLSSAFIIGNFRRRTILFVFGFATVTLMLIICLVTSFKFLTVSWLAPAFIVIHSFVVNFSIIPICFTLFGEMFPLEHKGWGSCLNGVIFTSLYTVLLKVTPMLIDNTGVGGVYVVYGITIGVCLLVLYFIMPETKDKNLQEIENKFKGVNLLDCDKILLAKLDT